MGLVSRIGNLDRVDKKLAGQAPKPRRMGRHTPAPGVNWINMQGPEVDGLDVEILTKMEMDHREFIWRNVSRIRSTPGYDKVYLMETAPS